MIHGDIRTLLDALGAREGDARLDAALELVGGDYETETYNERGGEATYLLLSDRGVDFLLENGVLNTVFCYATQTEDHGIYGGAASLVDGIDFTVSRVGLAEALGTPARITTTFLLYQADPGIVQFVFEGNALTQIVASRHDLGGGTPSELDLGEVVPDVGTVAVEGELAVFLRAVGHEMYSPEHLEAIVLAGPPRESYEGEADGAQWVYQNSPDTGVTLQFKEQVLVGALIELRNENGTRTYPSPELLIAGLPLPTSREVVLARLGEPDLSRDDMDLYLVGDQYLRFDFVDGQVASVTVVDPR